MRVAALRVELLIPASQSLKAKRSALRPLIEGLRRVGSYSVSEVGHHDDWQRATIGVAVVTPDGKSLGMQLDRIRSYLEMRLDVEVLSMTLRELEEPDG